MSDTKGKTGKVVEFDDEEGYGYIDYKHKGARVYLPKAQATGLKDDVEVMFDIELVGNQPHATNVKRK
ncbi:cold shock domain-containing protein [Pseudomonas soli]|nr:cold shock domain-containing protein [Pseudomonas soli]